MPGTTRFQSAKICAELTQWSSITTTQANINVQANNAKLSNKSVGIASGHYFTQTGVGWIIFQALMDDDMLKVRAEVGQFKALPQNVDRASGNIVT